MKHAPIGPTIAVGDVRPDGTVFVHTHNQNPQALRGRDRDDARHVRRQRVVCIYAGPGHYGRSNGGNAGAEDEAVILSKAVGRPVRVQWMRRRRPEVVHAIAGRVLRQSDWRWMPWKDTGLRGRPLHAGDAGRSARRRGDRGPADAAGARCQSDPVTSTERPSRIRGSTVRLPNRQELGHGTFQVGQKESPLGIGLRDHSMRTPGQLQQNFPRELAFSEAAAHAGVDAIEFRLDQTTESAPDRRPQGGARGLGMADTAFAAPGAAPRAPRRCRGQGVSVMLRSDTYWACVCQVTVAPSTGKVKVDKYTIAVDPGIVINPLQLKRQIQGGALMGLSHALYEEMTFDEGAVTSRDWLSYPVLTMADVPEIKVVILINPKVGTYGGGSEAANALAVSAIAAAFFDATGKPARRLPLKTAYVQSVLKT